MTSVFGQLFKYRPRENRLPQEDFFTEALAGVLEKTDKVGAKFVGWLIEHNDYKVEITEAKFYTQKQVIWGRLDIYINAKSADGQRHVVAVENKISAEESGNQLQHYLDHLSTEKDAETRTLVYITLLSEPKPFEKEPDNVTFKSLKWFQVYDWLKKESAKPEQTFLCDLLELMEEWNMTSEPILSAADLAAAIRYKKSVELQFLYVLDMVEEKLKREINECTGRWGSGNQGDSLCRYTPYLGDPGINYLQFGFDFNREDDDWNVEKLCIPSAYVGVGAKGEKPAFPWTLSGDWIDVPQYMGWKGGLYVKQM